ncbi:ribulose-phosphate 3-epimerase [Oceanobacillus sp. CFH 90083]|uniref:ribulose-phosphate 3-epimerase n=1 Tax=Oceanobacillus sp. CFH 90083 TaxID=2592336 RepID=UPI00128BC070|nr:ribulose-phosphate 3-epimerase [Oceanobacillus sp. CFH 90083]
MLICPSMMCANFDSLQKEVRELDIAGADIFHIDIMDGHFVPNFGMGLQDIEAIKKATKKQVDVHLMISNPGDYIELFAGFGVDIIYIHPESDNHPTRTLDKIKEKGKKAGIAINPGTSIHQIEELLLLVDYVLVMTVNPGFSGQKYLNYVDEKIIKLVNLKNENSFEIIVDGAVSPAVMKKLSGIGVDGFVLGTSALFGKKQKYTELMKNFKS